MASKPNSPTSLPKRMFDKIPGKNIFGRDPATRKLSYEFQNDWQLLPSLEMMERGEYSMPEATTPKKQQTPEDATYDEMLLVR
jgi:hypothetical protein